MNEKNLIPQTGLILGLLFLFFGGGLLFWTVGRIPFVLSILPLLLICMGVLLLYFVFYLDFSEVYLFMGMFLIQGAIFWVVKQRILNVYLSSLWPVFLLMSGLTLLPFALRKKRQRRTVFLVPAISFIVLFLFFIPFSLRLTSLGFLEFVKLWWPGGFLLLGIILLISHFYRSLKEKQEKPDSRK